MISTFSTVTAPVRLFALALMCPVCCLAMASSEEDAANLAIVATPSASYCSGDTSVEALQDGHSPRSSRGGPHGTYGNWNRKGTQWVQYDWPVSISTGRIEVYWWADGRGVNLPAASRLLYWDGGQFVPVPGAQQVGVERDQFNVVSFETVKTTKLRLEMDSNGEHSTGVLEWRVLDSGQSPAFPPQVRGDVERVVMLGGKTYLRAHVTTLGDPQDLSVSWSKESGPGEVQFDDPGSPNTTATCSELGTYVLRLTAEHQGQTSSASVVVHVQSPPTARPLDTTPTTQYRIDNPLWRHRAKALITAWIPHCVDKVGDPELGEGGINNFVETAKKLRGEPAGKHRGYPFANAWVYQTIEAMSLALMVDPQGDEEIIAAQEAMRSNLEDWIPEILAAQESDGYIQTAFTLDDRKNRWTPAHRADHEGYVAGYFLEAAIVHHALTGGADSRLYDAAKKLADCWSDNIGPEPGKQRWYNGHQGMEMALVRFARYVNQVDGNGGGDRYVDLAKFLLDSREGGAEYDQSHLPVQQQYEAVGHAVRAVYSYAGMAGVANETGDLGYQSAVMSLWDNLIHKKYYVTGGVGSGETSEGFGNNYSLRNHSYCESCSSCGLVFFQQKMNQAYHDAKYVDLYEETFYNALLGSLDLEGKNFYYQNPLSSYGPRYPWHVCPCCIGNIPRTLLMLPTWAYAQDDQGVYVNLFVGGASRLADVRGTEVEFVQETDYPWRGDVKITVNPTEEKRFAVRVRSPQRDASQLYSSTPQADGFESVLVNGEPLTPRIELGYLVIDREWKQGDTIELQLPLKVQRVKCIDRVVANRGRVALRRGPLVYSIETVDGNGLESVLEPDAELTAEWRPDLLGGVVVIKGQYADGSPLLAIPNYARNNRGGRSAVWIRDRAARPSSAAN